jgi:disulfide bond formation protein DsbB
MKLSTHQWGSIFATIAIAVLATVYISQIFFHMPPCHLCLIQRVPYFVALLLSLLVIFIDQKFGRILLWLLALTFAVSFALGLFHFGVEQKWWTYASNCTATNLFKPGASVADMMAALKQAPVVRCDQSIPFLFGLGMAFYNMIASIAFTALALYAAANRNARSE